MGNRGTKLNLFYFYFCLFSAIVGLKLKEEEIWKENNRKIELKAK